MMMVVPLDIFYEVIFSRQYHNFLKATLLPVPGYFFVFVFIPPLIGEPLLGRLCRIYIRRICLSSRDLRDIYIRCS